MVTISKPLSFHSMEYGKKKTTWDLLLVMHDFCLPEDRCKSSVIG